MKNKKTIKNIILGLVIAICVLIVYSVLSGKGNESTGSQSSLSSLVGTGSFGQVQESNTDLANAEILRILGSIQNITLDDDIFNNPVFRELEDSRFTIPKPVRVGRPNPFRPIGFDAVVLDTGNQGLGFGNDQDTGDGSDFFDETI
ncbi:hypothetical protein KC901_00110 [Patescibacteria group bacterium]|nr:hypothetical protein [Patescibacteria group bacterium]